MRMIIKQRLLQTVVLLFCTSILAVAHAADDEAAQRAVDTRQGLFKVLGSYLGPIVGMAREQIPYDAARVADSGTKIAALATMIPDVLRADTRASGIESGALDGVWENQADIAEKAQALADAAAALSAATAEGQGAAMAAFRQTGAACKACHDEYRKPD